MVKIKNTGPVNMNITVIKEAVTLKPGEQKDIPMDPKTDRLEIQPTPS